MDGAVLNREQAEGALSELALLRQELSEIEADCEALVARERARAARRSARAMARATALEQALARFAARCLGAGAGPLVLAGGEVRSSCSVKLNTQAGTTWADVTRTLEQQGREDALVVRKHPDPEVLAAWTDEALAKIGVLKCAARRFAVATKPAPRNAIPRYLEEVDHARKGLPTPKAGKRDPA